MPLPFLRHRLAKSLTLGSHSPLYEHTPLIFFREQYYGLKLANALNLTINYELFLQTLERELFVEEIWFDFNLHYFLLILREMEQITNDDNFMARRLSTMRWDIATGGFSDMSISEIFRHVYRDYTLDMLSLQRDEFIELMLDAASNSMQMTGLESSLYDYVRIRLMLGRSIVIEWLTDRIMSHFFVYQGGFSADHSEQHVNLMSTYRMIRLIDMFDLEFDYMHYILLHEYRGEYGGYFFMREVSPYGIYAYGPGFILEAWYNGLFLYNFLSGH